MTCASADSEWNVCANLSFQDWFCQLFVTGNWTMFVWCWQKLIDTFDYVCQWFVSSFLDLTAGQNLKINIKMRKAKDFCPYINNWSHIYWGEWRKMWRNLCHQKLKEFFVLSSLQCRRHTTGMSVVWLMWVKVKFWILMAKKSQCLSLS